MKKFIAERKLTAKSKETGACIDVIIQIGIPYWIEKGKVAACPREWKGIFEEVADAQGIDLLHALQLASDIETMLGMLKGKYIFYWPSGESYFDEE